ncbi:MAG: ABC transporter permease [Actinomycetota bacterium]|nr:ABC transporter permease [Actinomycetota bacterium]
MIKVTLKGMAGRKVRAMLTAIAIVLGVAMVSGSFVLTDTISKAFTSIFTSAYDQTDAVISGKSLGESAASSSTVSPALLARVRQLPDVKSAAGSIIDLNSNATQAKLVDRDGKAIQSNGNPTFGFGIDPSQPRFNPMTLVTGRWAGGLGEVVIDAETAKKHHYAVGDAIGVSANGPVVQFRIAGTATYGSVSSLGGATFAVFSIPAAQQLLKIDGFTSISVAAKDGVSPSKLVSGLKTVAPSTANVRSGDQQASKDRQGISQFISVIRGFLLGFGGIALFVGGFVIFNTLSITVRQRTRELATLRTLGASRRQVRRLVVIESLVIGAIASVTGLLAGFGLARGLSALFKVLGLALPESAPVYALHTFVVSFVVGIGITLVAGLAPAIRATRVPPIAAVREGAELTRRKRRTPIVGLGLFAAAVALVLYAVTGGQIGSASHLLALAVGALLGLLGVALFASRLVEALAYVVGFPSRRFGGAAGQLASENAMRNPGRTAATAGALMIGLALVSFVAVLAKGVHGSVDNAVRGQFTSDYVVTSQNGWTPFPVGAGDALARVPGVTRATSIRNDRGLVGKRQATVNSVDPKTIGGMYHFDWKQGSDATLAQLAGNGAVLKQAFANGNNLRVGDTFTLKTSALKPLRLKVVGIFQPPRLAEMLGGVVISQESFDRNFPRPLNSYTLVSGSPSADALKRAVASFPDAKVNTRDEFVKSQSSFLTTLLNLLYVLLALSVVVSLFGMINTLILSVYERTRELGMLRAVGMTRRQARRMVRHESVVTALIGAALGLPLGILLAAAVTHSLSQYGVEFSLPVVSLAGFTVVAIVAGIIAAIAPARRASRLNVLNALQYE